MKKNQVNFAKELDEMGKAMIEGFMKGIEKANNEQNPFDNMFSEIKNDQMKQVYEGCKEIGELLSHMIKGFMDGGLTKEEAMAFTMHNYIDMNKQAE